MDKNLGKEYNDEIRPLPDGDHVCITDHDVLLLSPNTKVIISGYVERHPDAVLTCYATRLNPKATKQLWKGKLHEEDRIKSWVLEAMEAESDTSVTPIRECISGFLMCFSKKIWNQHNFPELGQCLGVDSAWSKILLEKHIRILRMNGVLVWHTYRIINGVSDKSHLK